MCGLAFSSGKVCGQVRLAELMDHGHHQIRRIRAQEFFQVPDAVGHLDGKADALAGFGKLLLQLGAVGDKDHLPVGQGRMAIHLAHHEHHGQRFARALGVPDDAAALAGVRAFQQALDRQLDRAELLVAAHDLDGLAFVVGGKEGEGADQIEQVVAVEHAGHQALLVVGTAGAVIQILHGAGIGVGPAEKEPLAVGGDGAELGLLAAGGDHELVVIKQRRTAFALGPALLAVAQHLVDGFGHGLLDFGRFALDHHHRQAVQKQHDVRNDVVLGAQNAHLELADGDKAVVVPVLEIDKAHRGALFARLAVLADAGVFQQQVQDMAVVLDQAGAGKAGGELLDHFLHLVVFQPGVDDLQLLAQHRQHHHLGKGLAKGVAGMLFVVQVDDLPAKPAS